jgi:primosomal protein N' (replication factor Y)
MHGPAAPVHRLAVLVDTPAHSGLDGPLDYLCDRALPAGTLVRVPLGRRTVTGVVWQDAVLLTADAPALMPEAATPSAGDTQLALDGSAPVQATAGLTLKPVTEVLDGLPPLPAAWRQLVAFTAGYYQRGLGEIATMVLPPELKTLDATQWGRRHKRLEKALGKAPPEAPAPTQAPELSPEQAQACAALAGPPQAPFLLWGSTGSGKTEVYLHRAQAALDAGQQVLMLVPEINLTPQLEARVAERFAGRHIVSLHSGLTPAQRLRHWLLAHLGEADIVLGTRLAVFTPLPRLGLIVVDEEHDPSYKQQDGARYSARDLAVLRGRMEGATVVLGSATPSLESWHNALPVKEGGTGRYVRLAMPSRVGGGAMPRVRLLDMATEPKLPGGQPPPPLSPALLAAITQRVARGEQSLVLLNRRGYAPVLHCSDCGWKSGCPHCSAWRVFHKVDRSLRCHHCGFAERVPRACPDCGNTDIQPVGRGTERLEEQLAEALPGARLGRIDADVTKHKGALESKLAEMHAGEVDVLVGTQMVAKGHDFRRITLVAAANPDAALFASDFRAAERQFALLLQAAGRAGRDASVAHVSEMWIQTWHAAHPLYQALARYDFEAFAQSQLKEREMAGLPPYASLAMLRAEGKTQAAAQGFLADAAALVTELAASLQGHGGLTVYPTVPSPVQKVANVERAQLLIESPSRPLLQRFLQAAHPTWLALGKANRPNGLLRWAVDVDPLSI